MVFATKVLGAILVVTILSLILRLAIGSELLVGENSGFGWFVGILGTFYTFIAAFIIVTVWGQFNSMSAMVSREAKLLSSLWNYTDYLNDEKVSTKMKTALLAYIDKIVRSEKYDLSKGTRIVHPSTELIGILDSIDRVRFDDDRDAVAFSSLIQAYEDLSSTRSERIESGLARVPFLLKLLHGILALLLLVSIGLIGYVNIGMFLFAMVSSSLFVSMAFFLADDLDNPFEGIWNIDFSPFEHIKEYIERKKHGK